MLFLCLTLGMALRKLGQFPDNAHVTINAFIVKIALRASFFSKSTTSSSTQR
jgi:predicted permease